MRDVYQTMDDGSLISLLHTNDEDAYTEIYNRYWKKIFFIAASKLQNFSEAEELVQDIFADLWNRRQSITINSSLGAYLATAVKYRVINYLAGKQTRFGYIEHSLHTQSAVDHSTEQWLSFEELRQELESLVAALPEKCQLVYRLSREEGLSQKQISKKLGIAEKTVEAHIGKALQNIRTGLGNLLILFPLIV